MSKSITKEELSDAFDSDMIWRRKELSDLKSLIKVTQRNDKAMSSVLLKSAIAISYAHWEGHVRFCSVQYYKYIAHQRHFFKKLERQIYVNKCAAKLAGLYGKKINIKSVSEIINSVIDGEGEKFSKFDDSIINTRSNLNSDVAIDICVICGVDSKFIESERLFIDKLLVGRRNSIAHGQDEKISANDIDDFIDNVLSLMSQFRGLVENKIYTNSYLN